MEYRLAIFDIDGTLTEIKPEARAARPEMVTPNALGEQQPMAGVVAKLAELQRRGVKIALATNRGGVAWGYNTLEEAEALGREAAALCGVPDAPLYLCPYHAKAVGPKAVAEYAQENDCRKPKPGMLLQAMAEVGAKPEETIFVGDMATDEEAAKGAGVRFVWAGEYFGGKQKATRN